MKVIHRSPPPPEPQGDCRPLPQLLLHRSRPTRAFLAGTALPLRQQAIDPESPNAIAHPILTNSDPFCIPNNRHV